jgi:hypothetical protein
MRTRILAPALVVVFLAMSCKTLDVADFNASALSDLQTNPTAASVATAATGLLVGNRLTEEIPQVAFAAITGELGREGYSLDPSNPNITVTRLQAMDDAFSAGGASVWTAVYRSIKQAAVVVKAVDGVTTYSAAQKSATKGFARTMEAQGLLEVADVMDDAGMVGDFSADFSGDPKPLLTRDQSLARISGLLDSAKTELMAAGNGAFPFPLSAGFSGFDAPVTFLRFNRALKARVETYRGSYGGGAANFTAALAALAESFVDTTAAMSLGVYHTFSAGSGDKSNPLYDPVPRIIFAHPATLAEAKLNGATKDLRATTKVGLLPQAKQVNGITVDSKLLMYPSAAAPLAIIRNEELILLRAEANMQTGNLAGALDDINVVRRVSGGLPPIGLGTWTGLSLPQQVDSLLYERRYSLLMEGGHRWIDARRYGRLATLPKALPAHKIFSRVLLPDDECVARSPKPAGCTAPPGL